MKISYLLLVLCSLALVACFKVRPVEPPSSTSSSWISPTDYTILLDNLKTSIAERNTQNYIRCFDQERLRFLPAGALFNGNEGIWLNWAILDEQGYFDNMISELTILSGNSLSLIELDLQNVTADSLRYVGEYSLRVNHSDTLMTTFFKGQVQFLMRVNAFNEWAIEGWEDVETHPDSSWSLLKLRYIQ